MKFRKISEDEYFIQLFPDESIHDELRTFASEMNLKSGIINGIGAIKNVTLGYYDIEQKSYITQRFEESHEVISLSGNLALVDNDPFFHIHVAISDSRMNVLGGHLVEGKVSVILELYLRIFNTSISRKNDDTTGLKIWDLQE